MDDHFENKTFFFHKHDNEPLNITPVEIELTDNFFKVGETVYIAGNPYEITHVNGNTISVNCNAQAGKKTKLRVPDKPISPYNIGPRGSFKGTKGKGRRVW